MQLIAPPPSRQHWVYDDPSGVAEPAPYLRPWKRREPARAPRVVVASRRRRPTHREA